MSSTFWGVYAIKNTSVHNLKLCLETGKCFEECIQLYDEEEKTLRTWNYLNLAFVWYKDLCRSWRLFLRLNSICIILHIILSLFNNNWIFVNNQNRVLKMLGVASNAFNGCVCRAWFRPVVLFHTYDQKGYVIY